VYGLGGTGLDCAILEITAAQHQRLLICWAICTTGATIGVTEGVAMLRSLSPVLTSMLTYPQVAIEVPDWTRLRSERGSLNPIIFMLTSVWTNSKTKYAIWS
jgi:hypothetical protein